MKMIWACCACLCLLFSLQSGPAYADDTLSSLRLADALNLAMAQAPAIKGADADYGVAAGERRQAAAYLNPIIGVESENVAGSGLYHGTDGAELTASVSQTFEIGGKRSSRIRAADQGQTLARYDQSRARLDLIRNVTLAFIQAAATQEEASLAAEQATLARDVYRTVDKRVSAAAEPLVQRHKAKISLVNAELAADRAKAQQNAAFKMLTAQWGDDTVSSIDTSDFYKIKKPVVVTDDQELLRNTIDYQQKLLATDQARSLIDVEKANAVPNPTVSVGVRDFRATDDQAFITGVSLPLPVFNQNRGNVAKARYQAVKMDTELQKLLLNSQANLAEHTQLLQNAYLTATRIKNTILPEARKAFAQAKRGYHAGQFAYLEVLDAQRTLTDTRLTYIQALRDYHSETAEIARLTAQDSMKGPQP